MAQLTISAAASVTLDGLVTAQECTYIADVTSFLRLTTDVDNTYSYSFMGMCAFALIENVGADDILISMTTSGASKFIGFGLAPGAHCFISGRHGNDIDGVAIGTNIAIRSVTGTGSRVVMHVGANAN